ncbi:MAG: acyl-CoA dehydrogenase family protein [Deltaproteobacteria bacterium]|nr:acyl-CoA dehydrogenase family protein [Deltaproteobacteria bacterium]
MELTSVNCGPFFEDRHRDLARSLGERVASLEALAHGHDARAVAEALGREFGLYRHLAPAGGIDVRALVVIRDVLGYACPVGDAIFAVQGLGTHPLVLAGTAEQRARFVEPALAGERIAAFALTEPEAGSDVASMRTTARRAGDAWVLDGEKWLISNVPIADHHVVFARVAGEGDPRRAITAFVVPRGASGLSLEAQPMSIDHPIGVVRLDGCRVTDAERVGAVGEGMKLALATLETFRVSVGAAANGMATAALEDAIAHVTTRVQFGKPLSEQQLVQAYLAEMATELDAARLLVARAAWVKDTRDGRTPTEVAMAKMVATESAQRIIDRAVQLLGGRGVLAGSRVEALYRDIRPLRIYEGTTEIQKLIIARALLSGARST